ncbi:hypothetical protein QQ020_12140 [Fulvivirgaceae bacterium BMA12]|uniref:Uncharacterized protein n=1 Tax=Agaribacillus aureus TaxID=3051825 RepID=A0ABT8L510_9BACT|nr:hypothetical protein [Fulvivirgaceae bacterium BMA12]
MNKEIEGVFNTLTGHIPNWRTADFTGSSGRLHEEFTEEMGIVSGKSEVVSGNTI